MKWLQHALLFALVGGLSAIPSSSSAALPFFSQDRNYLNWISSLIYADLFVTDPTVTVAQGSTPNLEVFLIQNTKCVDPAKPLTYRLLVNNSGDAVAHDLFITTHYTNATFKKATRPADTNDASNQTLVWSEPALIPGDFMSFTITLQPSNTPPVSLESTTEYTYEGKRYSSITSHTIGDVCTTDAPFNPRTFLKNLWP